MSRNHKFLAVSASVISLLIALILYHSRTKEQPSQVLAPQEKERMDLKAKPEEPWYPTPQYFQQLRETDAEFFGQVVDQFGVAVQDAEISWTAERMGTQIDTAPQEFNSKIKTDTEGKFHIESPNTVVLKIEAVPSAGYYSSGQNTGVYSYYPVPIGVGGMKGHFAPPFQPYQETPVVFLLKKKGVTEPLLARNLARQLRDKNLIRVGLLPTQSVEFNYHFDSKVVRVNSLDHRPVYRWGFKLEVPDGGAVERINPNSEEPDSFIAPPDDYRRVVEVEYGDDDESYRANVTREFFIKFGDGTYARLNISLAFNGSRHIANFNSWFNPSGSRATEFDETKRIDSRGHR